MENYEFEIARKFVEETDTPIFLTGKAGTGKTTFLREITKNTGKNHIIVAPTGVAAINAGGVTIHSMFGLPTRAFVPDQAFIDPNLANNIPTLIRHFHYNRDKLKLFRELELLIIDEISMVRADLLDAVNLSLQYTRRSEQPFGGVQVLFIGDMYQLPPVVRDHEWPVLSPYYSSPYFFDSQSFKKMDPAYIELRKIYRQSDRTFIQILNNIRNQDFQYDDYEILKNLYNPEFTPDEPGYITLTTHNRKADEMNERELARLEDPEVVFDATIKGEFGENMYPAEGLLRLKCGAQVMFVKNDTSGERKYFNGKIGVIDVLDPYADKDKQLRVTFPDSGESIYVERAVWENVRYTLNESEGKIEQDQIGSFTQFPLRLAWAVTIHKSQGLTFEKAVVDAGESFAPGQVYVALSRCTSMEFLVLKSLITNRSILSDERIVEFSGRVMREMVLENKLEAGSKNYAGKRLQRAFDFSFMHEHVDAWEKSTKKLKTVDALQIVGFARQFRSAFKEVHEVAQKFQFQLRSILNGPLPWEEKIPQLQDRVTKAADYFMAKLNSEIIQPLQFEIDDVQWKNKRKKYTGLCMDLLRMVTKKTDSLFDTTLLGIPMYLGDKPVIQTTAAEDDQPKKGHTYSISLELFKQGLSLEAIAKKREMAVSTIESHAGIWLKRGEVALQDLLSQEKAARIADAVRKSAEKTAGSIKQQLGDEASWAEIRWVLQSMENAVRA
ncbi:MAG: helix-turn-helix domain-containing protein [Bacteroidia bacterium]|jgi:ATP-dependent DNA helicase PIF1